MRIFPPFFSRTEHSPFVLVYEVFSDDASKPLCLPDQAAASLTDPVSGTVMHASEQTMQLSSKVQPREICLLQVFQQSKE